MGTQVLYTAGSQRVSNCGYAWENTQVEQASVRLLVDQGAQTDILQFHETLADYVVEATEVSIRF